jgi:DHA2 family multidrug resistance protein-like MFS transporter
VAPCGGFLADRLGSLLILRTGAGLVLAGLLSLVFTGPDTSTLGLAARFVVIGLGFGLFQAPNLNEMLMGVKPSLVGLAASTNAVLKNLGSLLGITLIASVFAWLSAAQASSVAWVGLDLTVFQKVFALTVLAANLNLLVNLLPRQP